MVAFGSKRSRSISGSDNGGAENASSSKAAEAAARVLAGVSSDADVAALVGHEGELPAKLMARLIGLCDPAGRAELAARPEIRECSRRLRGKLAADQAVAVRAALFANPAVGGHALSLVARFRHLHPLEVLCAAASNRALPASSFMYLEHDAGAHPATYPPEQRRGQHILDQALAANVARPATTTEALWDRARHAGAYSPDVPEAAMWVLCALVRAGSLDRAMWWDVRFSQVAPDKLGFVGPEAERHARMVRAHWASGPDCDTYDESLAQDDDMVAHALATSGHPRSVGADWRLAEHPTEAIRRAYADARLGRSSTKADPRLTGGEVIPTFNEQIAQLRRTWPASPSHNADSVHLGTQRRPASATR